MRCWRPLARAGTTERGRPRRAGRRQQQPPIVKAEGIRPARRRRRRHVPGQVISERPGRRRCLRTRPGLPRQPPHAVITAGHAHPARLAHTHRPPIRVIRGSKRPQPRRRERRSRRFHPRLRQVLPRPSTSPSTTCSSTTSPGLRTPPSATSATASPPSGVCVTWPGRNLRQGGVAGPAISVATRAGEVVASSCQSRLRRPTRKGSS